MKRGVIVITIAVINLLLKFAVFCGLVFLAIIVLQFMGAI